MAQINKKSRFEKLEAGLGNGFGSIQLKNMITKPY